MMLRQVFPSRTLAFYTAKMFLVRTFAFLAGLALIAIGMVSASPALAPATK